MRSFPDVALSFVERCKSHRDLKSLVADFSNVIAQFGFDRFMMTRLPGLGHDPEPLILAHTWSLEWGDQYRAKNYFWSDPVSHFSFAHNRPFTWSEARLASEQPNVAQQIASEARSVGMLDGLGFPLADPRAVQSVISLSSDTAVDLPDADRAMLHMACIYCGLHAADISAPKESDLPKLTAREREVLRWLAHGKSAWETSAILNASESTIKTHLEHIRQKLSATTTTQAVATALYTRQIHL